MKATILLFNIKNKSRIEDISRALLPLRMRIKIVKKEEYLQPVGFLAGKKDINSIEQIYQGEELDDEMLLMAGMTNIQIDQVLLAFRKAGISRINCKAVLTGSNQNWNALQLFEELKKEHESFR